MLLAQNGAFYSYGYQRTLIGSRTLVHGERGHTATGSGRAYRFAATGAIRCVVVATGRLKMRDIKIRDQIAGVENAGKVSMESQSVKKCLKVVVEELVSRLRSSPLYSNIIMGYF